MVVKHEEVPLVNGKAAALEGGGKGIAGAATVGGSGGKVSQQPASSSFSLAYQAKNALVWGLSKVIRLVDGSARQRYGWDPYMLGSFAPVHSEVYQSELEVIDGALPADLSGAFLRNGPNPKLPVEGGYHWFDGDGMVHAVRIRDGKASFCNRWVRTSRLEQEERAGWALHTKIGDYRGLWFLPHLMLRKLAIAIGLLDATHGTGTGNTALAAHAGRLLALHEGDLPYALRVTCSGLVDTIGRVAFDGKLDHAFTAHPKIDPDTREMFYFGYSTERAPHCWYGWLDPQGRVVRDFPVPLKTPIMMHDCAITEHYMLLLDVPLEFDPQVMVKEGKLPFVFKKRPTRIGVLPRYAESGAEVRWFDTENYMCFHTANAWEEGPNTIRLFLCAFREFSLDSMTLDEGSSPFLTEVTLDLAAGSATTRRLPGAVPGDFPVVPPSLVGRPTRYTYLGAMAGGPRGEPRFIGVTKYDLSKASGSASAVAAQALHGGRRYGGEAVFAPKPGASEEDEGWLMTYVTDEDTLQSELVIFDAQTLGLVCRLRMPQRVPHGFHGTWVSEQQLQEQEQQAAAAS